MINGKQQFNNRGYDFYYTPQGYQLKKNIRETVNPYFKINNNVLYPVLEKKQKIGKNLSHIALAV